MCYLYWVSSQYISTIFILSLLTFGCIRRPYKINQSFVRGVEKVKVTMRSLIPQQGAEGWSGCWILVFPVLLLGWAWGVWSKCVTCINSCNPPTHPMKKALNFLQMVKLRHQAGKSLVDNSTYCTSSTTCSSLTLSGGGSSIVTILYVPGTVHTLFHLILILTTRWEVILFPILQRRTSRGSEREGIHPRLLG